MCEQCLSKPLNYGEALPGMFLMRATEDGHFWKKDQWAIIRCNNPDFWWTPTPLADPDDGLSDEDIDKRNDLEPAREAFFEAACNIEAALLASADERSGIEVIFVLYEAAKGEGYNREEHGRFAFWLSNYLARYLKDAKPTSDYT